MKRPIDIPSICYRSTEVRALDDGSAGFDGHASTFWVVDSYGTAMKPGAFKKTLKERGEKVPLLWQHFSDQPIGKPTMLKEDKEGLAFKAAVVTDTRAGAEAMSLLRNDVPLGMSFGFQTIKSRPIEEADDEYLDWSMAPAWTKTKEGREWVSIIEEVRLWEISLVTFPANQNATISTVRKQISDDMFPLLLASIEDGTLDVERFAQIETSVAARNARAGADPITPLDPQKARRANDLRIFLAIEDARSRHAGVA